MVRRVRLIAGLVLLAYVTTHLLNHALGLISLHTAEAGLRVAQWFWRNPVVAAVLFGSLITHVVLALWSLYQRRTLRMARWDLGRILLGLVIPLLLIPHIVGTRTQDALFETDPNYTSQMLLYSVLDPGRGLRQIVLLVVAWTHGWMGFYYWLRMNPSRAAVLPTLRVLGLIIPELAILGFFQMGREVGVLALDPNWVRGIVPPLTAAEIARLNRIEVLAVGVFLGGLVLALVARPLRALWLRRHGLVRVVYPDGRTVQVVRGTSVLEASRVGGIPHASLCGGRARCSTCRSRIGVGLDLLPHPLEEEIRVLRRVNAGPNVRLACQVRPVADVHVAPLLPPMTGLPTDLVRPGQASGVEREIAVLFADMRSFTRLAENRLPYDVVFVLNQYADAMGRAIESAGGFVNQFVGDGIMALFGVESEAGPACREALQGAVAMARALDRLNETLAHDLPEPLRIGIGIHTGHVIVGEMGYGRARYLTAIGDVVNTASRLETLTKDYTCQLIVSDEVGARAGVDLTAFDAHETQVRGRTSLLQLRVIPSALDLEPLLASAWLAGISV